MTEEQLKKEFELRSMDDALYHERAVILGALARIFEEKSRSAYDNQYDAWIGVDKQVGWPVLYLEITKGGEGGLGHTLQMSWHINISDLPVLHGIRVGGPSKVWDGHTTDEKLDTLLHFLES